MSYTTTILAIQPDHIFGYWPETEASGGIATDLSGNAHDGIYSNVTLGQTGIGDGSTAGGYNGTSSFTDVYSAGLAAVFNGQEGTVSGFGRMPAATWDSATARRIITLQSNATNRAILQKISANTLNWFYQAGGVTESIDKTGMTTPDWFHVALTWSKTANEVKAYYGGVQFGSTQTSLGTYAAVPLSSIATTIGASRSVSPSAVWSGELAHVGLWDVALSAEEIHLLSLVFGPVTTPPERTIIVPRKDRTIIVPKKNRTIVV